MRAVITLMISLFTLPAVAETAHGKCADRAEIYQQRYERTGQASDLVCYQQALERELR